jgi:hypothetical protein
MELAEGHGKADQWGRYIHRSATHSDYESVAQGVFRVVREKKHTRISTGSLILLDLTRTASLPSTNPHKGALSETRNMTISWDGENDTIVVIPRKKKADVEQGTTAPERSAEHNEDIEREDTVSTQELYLQCKFSALYILALQKPKPVVHINDNTIMQDLDAFISGYLREDGCTSHLAPARDVEGVAEYQKMRDRAVSKLVERIRKRSEDNLAKEPKNRVVGTNNPEHGAFCNVIITPAVFDMYRQMRNTPKFGIDAENPQKCPKLWSFLSKVVAAQYDFEKWAFVSPKAVFNQKPVFNGEDKIEEFQLSIDYPDQIFAFLQFKIPGTEQYWSEIDVFDDLPAPVTNKRNFKVYSKHKFAVYFHPDPESVTIPGRIQGRTYTTENPE